MDPRATLNRIVDALHDNLIDEAIDAATDYVDWLKTSGCTERPNHTMTDDAWITLCTILSDYELRYVDVPS